MASFRGSSGRSSYAQQATPRTDSEQPYEVRLTPAVHSRLVEFFNRSDNAGLPQSAVIERLLNANDATTSGSERAPFESPTTRRRGLVTSRSHPMPQSPAKSTASRVVHPEPQDDDYDDDGQDSRELGDIDEEMNYGDDYVYEEVIVAHEETPEPPESVPTADETMHDYYYSLRAKPGGRRRTAPAERRTTRQNSPRVSERSQKKQYHPDRKGVGTGKQKPWTSNLRRYIYDLISKWQRDYLLHCRECDRWMRVAHERSGLRCGNVLDHVLGHVGKPMFVCRLCGQQTITQFQIRKHLSKAHGRTNDFDDLTDGFFSELEERVARCFDYSDVGSAPDGPKKLLTCKKKRGEVGVGQRFLNQEIDMESSSVRRFIYDLITKWQNENAIYCRNCNHWVRTGSESAWAQAQAALAHVCGHYGKELYVCLLCQERTVTYYQMIRHIRHVHQTISRGNCVEQVDDCAAELKEMAAKCFDWEEGSGPPALTTAGPFLKTRRPPRPKSARSGVKTDATRAELLEVGRRLIRDVSGKSRTMQCQRCGAKSIVKARRGLRPEVLIDHVMKHVDKDAYACPKCTKTAKRKDNMRMHLLTHKGAKTTEYIDKSQDLRDEILEIMKRCYDPNFKETEAEIAAAQAAEEVAAAVEADTPTATAHACVTSG